jgi:hypothetical protein
MIQYTYPEKNSREHMRLIFSRSFKYKQISFIEFDNIILRQIQYLKEIFKQYTYCVKNLENILYLQYIVIFVV